MTDYNKQVDQPMPQGETAMWPFALEGDTLSVFQGCELFEHPWKASPERKGSQCLCSQDVQKHKTHAESSPSSQVPM